MRSADRYRRLIHPLLSVFLPASFLIPVSAIVTEALRMPLPALFTASSICLGAGFLAALFENIAREERVRTPGRFRFALVLVGVCYFLVSAFRKEPLLLRFQPGFENLWYAVLAGAQWLSATSFQRTFRAREFLLEETEGKKGTELTLAIRDAVTLTGETLSGLKALRIASVVFSLTLALILFTIESFSVRIPTATMGVAIIGFFFLPLVAALTSQYAFEHDVAGEGFPVDEELRSRKLRIAFLMVVVPLALSPFVCGKEPPLSPELLSRFLAWFFGLFRFEVSPAELMQDSAPGMAQFMEELERLGQAEPAPPLIDLTWLIGVLKRALIIALPLVVIGFILAPIFSKNFRAALKKRSLLPFLLRKLREIASLFHFIRHKKKERVLVASDDLAPVREALAELARGKKTLRKRREVGRMTRRFLDLIAWGTERAVPYAPSTAPGEYVRKLVKLDPPFEVDFLTAGDVFEEALYSDHLLDAERLADYERAVRRIIAPKPDL